ncbi:MAG: type 4a pilus biogenesis protein PilO [Deltaproteobacteria bacterium]|nr:type 4a pilus biogenesis protein PilO [Deltaproteobacteria bacterium]
MKSAEAKYKIAMKALPDKKEIPSLLTGISEAGKEAGLEFLLFQPESEINKDFYAEIPVSIKVAGNYHNVGLFFDNVSRLYRIVNNVGLFFDNVSRLYRIVNVKNIVMTTPRDGDRLNSSCTAVTYRFVETEEKNAANPAKKK